MKIRINTGSRVSEGAGELAAAINNILPAVRRKAVCKVLRTEGSTYVPSDGDTIINWGSSKIKDFQNAQILNNFAGVANAVNKITTFNLVEPVIETSDVIHVARWGKNFEDYRSRNRASNNRGYFGGIHGFILRTTLTGHSGEGTEYVPTEAALIQRQEALAAAGTPVVLVQSYVQKNAEYRVHVFGGQVIDIQKKRRRTETEDTASTYIRNLDNGWVYCRGGVSTDTVNSGVLEAAIIAIEAVGLDFGAVDIMTVSGGYAYILEVNSAPGLSETTAQKYAEAICNYLQ